MSLETGQIIEGKYRIVRLIGEGGMGAVYEGENVRINRRVAIKILHAGFTSNVEVTQRFEREAQAAGRIGNDHILEVLDLGSMSNGDHFIVMEFLDGEPLSSRIKRLTRMTPLALAPLIRQVLVGLEAAHRAGIVHRDLKPDNIFILKTKAGNADYVKIIDFGISKFQPLSGDGMKMTRTGAVMGTPYYMSPEQASGSQEADVRSDLYSVGVILFEAVTGQVPFDAATFNQLLFKIVLSDVPRPETLVRDLDPGFASIITKAMARDVNQRFQTSEDFRKAIAAWLERGAAVTVPPSADPAAAALMPGGLSIPGLTPAPVPALASSQTGGQILTPAASNPGTHGSWATSQVEGAPPKKGSKLGVTIGAVVGVLAIGGAAFALLQGKPHEPTAASAVPVVQAPAAPPPAPVEVAPQPATPAPVAAPVETSAPVAAPAASSAETAKPVAPGPVARPASRPAAPAPAGRPRPAGKSGGSVDLGY
ncbi:MAG TPA: serine/threonine-protein kinase [Polyangiaceae bacterium]